MKTTMLLLLLAFCLPMTGHAASCDQQLRDDVDAASQLLNKAQEAKTFDDAKRGMHLAKYAINKAADTARTCPCDEAGALFDSAATKIGRASNADVSGRFNHFAKQGIEEYAGAVELLNACPASQEPSPVPQENPAAPTE